MKPEIKAEIERLCKHYGVSERTFKTMALAFWLQTLADKPHVELSKHGIRVVDWSGKDFSSTQKLVSLNELKFIKKRFQWKPENN